MNDPTIEQIIEGMPSRFNPDAAPDQNIILQFCLSGEVKHTFFAAIENNICKLTTGMHEAPTLTLKMSSKTYIDMVMGRITGQEAFFTRKLRYEGPIGLAIKLNKFFKPPESLN